jgi:exopolysaccharide biosynthesis polyprenyl glycosylphosphotransferase
MGELQTLSNAHIRRTGAWDPQPRRTAARAPRWGAAPMRRLRALGRTSRLAIVGAGSEARELARHIAARSAMGWEVACFVRLDGEADHIRIETANPAVVRVAPVIDAEALRTVARTHRIDRIVIAAGDCAGALPIDALLHCQTDGCAIEAADAFGERLFGRIAITDSSPERLLLSGVIGRSRLMRTIKRTVDIVSAAALFVLTAPLSLLVATLIKLEDGGPVIFQQQRVGRHGMAFTVHKFRSMRVDAEAETGPTWAQANDPRVTKIGRWLRALRIDEVPQLWNVLRGEMSFVGPRPERPEFVATLQTAIPLYDHRHAVRPGITGWAQVNFPYGSTVDDARRKLEYDLYYLKKFSLQMDLFIMLRTINIVLFGWRNR